MIDKSTQPILVVTSTKPLMNAILEILELEGYPAVGVLDWKAGIQKASEYRPALIICVVKHSDHDTASAVTELRSNPQTAAIRFIFMEKRMPDFGFDNDLKLLGISEYITIPFDPGVLISAIKAKLD